jgi:hypothetical protein
MSDLLLAKDLQKPAALKGCFDAAHFETILDNEGDLRVEDGGLGCYVLPINGGTSIKLLTVWQARKAASPEKRLAFAQRVNETVSTVRAAVNGDLIVFDYYIPVEGGINKKAVVLATKHFLAVQKVAVLECGGQEVLG